MAEQATLRRLVEHLGVMLAELGDGLADDESFERLFAGIGWAVESRPASYQTFTTALNTFVDDTLPRIFDLADDPSLDDVLALLSSVDDLYLAIGQLPAPDGSAPDVPLREMSEALIEQMVARYLAEHTPRLFWFLRLIGIVSFEVVEPAGANRSKYVRTHVNYDLIPGWIADPASFVRSQLDWGTDNFKFVALLELLVELLAALGVRAEILRAVDPELDSAFQGNAEAGPAMALGLDVTVMTGTVNDLPVEVGLRVLPLPSESDRITGLVLNPKLSPGLANVIPLLDQELRLESHTTATFGIVLTASDVDVRFPFGGDPLPSRGFSVALAMPFSPPRVLFGSPSGTRVQFGGLTWRMAVRLDGEPPDLRISVTPTDAAVVLALGEADGLLRKAVGEGELSARLDLELAWSSRSGFGFDGGVGFTIDSRARLDIGPVFLDGFRLSLNGRTRSGDNPPALIATGATRLGFGLGPVRLVADQVGVALTLGFADGNAGPFSVSVGFKAPSGVGVSVDAGPVAGGGFLFFEPNARRYGGALTLRIYEIEVSAFGIIETVLPGGQPGFSFAILISSRFTPIPIGLGFTLNGVGGLLGINRTVDTQALQDTVRTHTLDNVLFPEAPESNALEILGSLRALFPAAEGRFAFGPMAIIGWGGTIPVLEAEIGLILELPEPIRLTILGQVRAGLPDKDKAFVKLNFDAVGVLDFERKTFSLDASLYESNVGGFPISGDMALRLNWGSPPNFVLSIGGFHPQFQPPPGIPVLARVQVALGQNGNPRITIQGYLAITSNTAQIGARAEVLAFKGSFSLLGWIGFDALFTFQPFTFKADFSAGVALRKGSRHIASIRLHGTLTGPNPWHVSGEACLSLWFFDICIGFSVPLSDRKPEALQPAPAIAPRLRDALADLRNWSAELPAGAHQAVSLLVSPEARPAVLVDPLGGLSVRQRVVPLDVRITRFENVKLAKNAQPRFTIGAVTLGAGAGSSSASVGKVSDFFARAQFEDMSDAKKLSLPAFEAMTSGVSVQSAALDTRGRVDCEVNYETSVLDAPEAADEPGSNYIPLGSRLDKLARLSGSGLGGLRAVGPDQFGSRFSVLRTDLTPEPFTVAGIGGLVARPELVADVKQRLGFVSKANAQRILEQHLENNPADRGTLQVVPELELPRAA